MASMDPSTIDFLGAFLLAGICGGGGALVAFFVVQFIPDWTPATTFRRTAIFGSAIGLVYPVAWIVALDTVRNLPIGDYFVEVPVGGGVPGVVASGTLGVVFLIVTQRMGGRKEGIRRSDTVGNVVMAGGFAVSLSIAFAALLPVLFPLLT